MDGKNEEPDSQEKAKSAAPLKLVLKLHRNVTDDVKSKWTVAPEKKQGTTKNFRNPNPNK